MRVHLGGKEEGYTLYRSRDSHGESESMYVVIHFDDRKREETGIEERERRKEIYDGEKLVCQGGDREERILTEKDTRMEEKRGEQNM